MPEQQANTGSENAIGWMILGGVFLAIFALFWYFFEFQVKNVFRWIRWSEMWLISFFVDDEYAVGWSGREVNFQEALDYIPTIPLNNLNAGTIGFISTMSMEPFKIIFVVIMVLMALWCQIRGPGTLYRKKMNLNGLINAQSKTFPVIAPFMKFNPSNQPTRPPGTPVSAELPAFSEALGPEEWIAYNQIPVPDGALDEHAAALSFTKQLGPRWQGVMKLPPHKQILLASFCLRAARKRNESDDMLGRIALCWSHKKGLQLGKDKNLLKEARRILRNRGMAGSTLTKCNQHAFHTTALLRGLATAREEGGVLASSQFVWLRGFDRALWYPLNNMGRQSFHMEAIGAMAHFKAEKLTRRPIPKPKISNAVQSISEYMASSRARPIPQLDYSGTKKRGVKKPKGTGVKKPKKK